MIIARLQLQSVTQQRVGMLNLEMLLDLYLFMSIQDSYIRKFKKSFLRVFCKSPYLEYSLSNRNMGYHWMYLSINTWWQNMMHDSSKSSIWSLTACYMNFGAQIELFLTEVWMKPCLTVANINVYGCKQMKCSAMHVF